MRADGRQQATSKGGGLWLVPGQQCVSVCVNVGVWSGQIFWRADASNYMTGARKGTTVSFRPFIVPLQSTFKVKMASRSAPSGLLSRGSTVRLMAVLQWLAVQNCHHVIKASLWFSAKHAFLAVKLHTLFKMIRLHENVRLDLWHVELFVSFCPSRFSVVQANGIDGKGCFFFFGWQLL